MGPVGNQVKSAGASAGPLQEKPLTAKEKLRQNLKQKLADIRKAPLVQSSTQDAAEERKDPEERKDDHPSEKQHSATLLDPKKNLKQKRGKVGKAQIVKTSTAASSNAINSSEMQQEVESEPQQQPNVYKSEFRENAR